MKRLYVWITLLTVLCGGLIPIISVLGRTAPPPEFAKWFTYADGSPCPMPCLFGIRPRITKWKDVEQILRAHPVLFDLHAADENDGPSTDSYRVFSFHSQQAKLHVPKNNDGTVSYLIVNLEPFLDFKQVLLTLGSPQRVSLSWYNLNNANVFLYQSYGTAFGIYDTRPACQFRLETSINEIILQLPAVYEEKGDSESFEGSMPKYYRWIGFSRYAYWQLYYADSGQPFDRCTP